MWSIEPPGGCSACLEACLSVKQAHVPGYQIFSQKLCVLTSDQEGQCYVYCC
jgi:hypothetical protein